MVNTQPKPLKLASTYIWLDDHGAAKPFDLDHEFWPNLMAGKLPTERRLMGVYNFTKNSHWEMHPKGDEILYLLSGKLDCILEINNKEECTTLAVNTALIIPQGCWHRIIVNEPGQILGITAGEGTEHRSQ